MFHVMLKFIVGQTIKLFHLTVPQACQFECYLKVSLYNGIIVAVLASLRYVR